MALEDLETGLSIIFGDAKIPRGHGRSSWQGRVRRIDALQDDERPQAARTVTLHRSKTRLCE